MGGSYPLLLHEPACGPERFQGHAGDWPDLQSTIAPLERMHAPRALRSLPTWRPDAPRGLDGCLQMAETTRTMANMADEASVRLFFARGPWKWARSGSLGGRLGDELHSNAETFVPRGLDWLSARDGDGAGFLTEVMKSRRHGRMPSVVSSHHGTAHIRLILRFLGEVLRGLVRLVRSEPEAHVRRSEGRPSSGNMTCHASSSALNLNRVCVFIWIALLVLYLV